MNRFIIVRTEDLCCGCITKTYPVITELSREEIVDQLNEYGEQILKWQNANYRPDRVEPPLPTIIAGLTFSHENYDTQVSHLGPGWVYVMPKAPQVLTIDEWFGVSN